MRIAIRLWAVLVVLCLSVPLHAALTADNLLLVVNKNEPQGQALAEHYAQVRHVPDGRIVSLDLPKTDDISFDDYETRIVGPLRQEIAARHLQSKITCIVLFYGVPLRIAQRTNSPQDEAELKVLHDQIARAVVIAQPLVEGVEKLAKQADASFSPLGVGSMEPAEALPRRAQFAVQFLIDRIGKMPQGADRMALEEQASALSKQFRAPVQIDEPATNPAADSSAGPSTEPTLSIQQMAQKVRDLSTRRWDPTARRELRQVLRQSGVLNYLEMLQAQADYFMAEDTQAAVDNELALLWWNYYPRIHWQPNPLNYKYSVVHANPTLMVMRLDAPTPRGVLSMIDTSIKIEAEGLKGNVVLDSRGMPPQKLDGQPDPYGEYDQTIRNLGMLLRARSKLPLIVDDRPTLLPPNSAKDVAVYCGWYSPGKYVHSVSLVPGAVAVHIASFEMQTLHNPTSVWCRHLIEDGAVATFGPVSEPYLSSFPLADEFFPLLFTGKLPLAEVYWRTTPLTSWRIVMVGDPLYTPFKTNPALKIDDLPLSLQKAITDTDPTESNPKAAGGS